MLAHSLLGKMVGRVGLEPTANGLKGRCSTIELPTQRSGFAPPTISLTFIYHCLIQNKQHSHFNS